jgi:peptidyl-prolyl cis-trans isomerase D
MISMFRRFSESWIARIFFVVMAFSFVGWGISSDLFRLMGPPSWVAKIGGQTIEIPAFQSEFQRDMAQAARDQPPGQEPSAALRRQIGQQTLERLVARAAIGTELASLRIVTPDDAVAAVARSMPAFQGRDGQFSKAQFDSVLRNNGYTEARFLAQLRADIAQRQLLTSVSAGMQAPAAEVTPLYESEFEKRSADTAFFPLAAAPEPATPDQATLERWYDNHPDSYATPEFRRIKAIELSPQSVAADVAVTDAELHAAYDEHRSQYATPGKRSAQILSVPDEAKARDLADRWRAGADWAAMQEAAKAASAVAITQDDATEVQFPDPDLARAVFSGPEGSISAPVKGALGWFVVKVTHIVPGTETSFEQARDSLRAQVLAGKAADVIYDRANTIDQLLGNGTGLDDMPGDLGLIGVAGTMDSRGETQDGTPAPIPGPPELKAAIIAAAFQARQGDPPRLTEVQTPSSGGSAYYALSLESVIPPGEKPFEAVKDRVAGDWKQDQRRRAQERAATAMMTAVQGGRSFSDAAAAAGVTPKLSPLVTRGQGNPAIPADLQRIMFGLKKGEATMVETPEGFMVAQLTEIVKPDAGADKTGYDEARTAVTRSIGSDVETVFIDAVRQRARPQFNQQAFDSVVQAQQ